MMDDISETVAADVDQMTADDFLAGPRTLTIVEVREGPSIKQPVEIVFAEFDPSRPWRPNKSMRRVIIGAWGARTAVYVGRRVTLFRDAGVKFGPDTPGGIRLSHLSDISKPLSLPITVTKGKKAPYKVQPLPDAPPPDPNEARIATLLEEYAGADTDRQVAIRAEVESLRAERPGGAA